MILKAVVRKGYGILAYYCLMAKRGSNYSIHIVFLLSLNLNFFQVFLTTVIYHMAKI